PAPPTAIFAVVRYRFHPDFSEFHLTSPDFTFSSQKPIFPSQIPRIFCPLLKRPGLPQGWRGAGCIEGAR
ncbi:TPA: hypothetical protein ACNU17_004348, partial [Aeromonas salmonicida subsp. pectinolytica]